MPAVLSPQAFVAKWRHVTTNERASAQSHFNDLCAVLGQPTPLDLDPHGQFYRFEKPLTKVGGGAGYADVWKRDFFAWEYKTKGKYPNLAAAYQQLLIYKEDLDNPPILAACDIANYEIHIAFTGHKTRVERFTNEDIGTVSTRDLLRLVFTDPEQLRPTEKVFSITEKIAADFAQVAQWLEQRGHSPERVAHFFMKLLFAMFAEDIGLLPNQLLTTSIKTAIFNPTEFNDLIRPLFRTMRDGGYFGPGNKIPHFNGGLFDDDDAIPLTADDLMFLQRAAQQRWEDVEPAIFGTLLERSLDPRKRSQLGAHYTSRDDILLLVEPVLMHPLRQEWAATRTEIEALRPAWEASSGGQRQVRQHEIEGRLFGFLSKLGQTKVLDPACGSGNFLYVALHQMKGLEKEVIQYATGVGLPTMIEPVVAPHQFLGIEINPFAAELAQVVVWIGYLQWNRKNGFWKVADPVLQKLDSIRCQDAILSSDSEGQPTEPEWPDADVIIGNPPFLGGNKIRQELGDDYVDDLFSLYSGRVPAFSDLVCYWFERARTSIAAGTGRRAGLLATNSIRGGANRKVLERIKATGDIFMAWGDRPWILDGAAVRVSMVGFDDGHEHVRRLNDTPVPTINADLTTSLNLTAANRLSENLNTAFMGMSKKGPFDIPADVAGTLLHAPVNPNGCFNSDVIRPWVNGLDITRRPRGMWIVDFGVTMTERDAAYYEQPFEYVRRNVLPVRSKNNRESYRKRWWLHAEPRPGLRAALLNLNRYIATPTVAKHRLFVWLDTTVIPDQQIIAIARDDDYFFGVLHSKLHELWALRMGTSLEDRPRYTPTTTFETFPFPWPPGCEPLGDSRVDAIAKAAHTLVRLRDAWLNPSTLFEDGSDPEQLQLIPVLPLPQRTLTTLYNRRPDWLVEAHEQLDHAVLDAYGWPHDLSDDEILSQLLALNLERSAAQGAVAPTAVPDEEISA
ncbi:MAG TPA: DNA methyltransferase [Herpetosiphonaceae bacterium]|nr:DNA methyltransferase [Herpetosiphonaceae bacterium]